MAATARRASEAEPVLLAIVGALGGGGHNRQQERIAETGRCCHRQEAQRIHIRFPLQEGPQLHLIDCSN